MSTYCEVDFPLPGRDSRLPSIKKCLNHPLANSRFQRSWIFPIHTTTKAMSAARALESTMAVPEGGTEGALSKGFLEVSHNDIWFTRNIEGSNKPEDDICQGWVLGPDIITPAQKNAIDKARDQCLGPREKRTCTNADIRTLSGGTAFERSKHAKPRVRGKRVYTIGPSIELQKRVMAPCASAKIDAKVGETDHHKCRQDLTQAVANIAQAAFEQAPDEIYDNVKSHSDLRNAPPYGSATNFAYATGQLNLAPAMNRGRRRWEDLVAHGQPDCGASEICNEDEIIGYDRAPLSQEMDSAPTVSQVPVNALDLLPLPAQSFLARAHLTTLKNEIKIVSASYFQSISIIPLNRRQVLSIIDIIERPLALESSDAVVAISNLWKAFTTLKLNDAANTITTRLEHGAVMNANYLAWLWLEVIVADQCEHILSQARHKRGCSWLALLIHDASIMVVLRQKSRTFSPTTYGINLRDSSFTYVNHRKLPLSPTNPASERSMVTAIVTDVLRQWLGFPSDNSRYQAWFIRVITQAWGSSVLYLDVIWQSYKKIARGTYFKSRSRALTFACMEPFQAAVQLHPFADPTSEEVSCLDEFSELIGLVKEGTRDNLLGMELALPDPIPSSVYNNALKRSQALLDFLREAYAILTKTVDQNNTSILQRAMIDDPDYYFPFREHAPSRLHIAGPDGPFTPRHVRTASGLFSALVFRGITFGTQLSRDGPSYFSSVQDWSDKIAGMDDDQICNPSAYGQTIHGRNKALAPLYWKAASSGEWEKLVGNGMVDFVQGYTFLQLRRFPQLGPLGAYLLSADLVYAGVFKAPSLDEISITIRSMNKGAVAALVYLGLAKQAKTSAGRRAKLKLDACRAAIMSVDGTINEFMNPEMRSLVTMDFIGIEHTLCKFVRAINKKLITID